MTSSPSSTPASTSSSLPFSSSTSTSPHSFSSRKFDGFRSISPKTILQMQPMAPYQRAVRIGRGDPPNFVIPPLDKSERSSPKTTNKRDKIPQLVNFFAGGFGGMMGALITCPLEVVKTRLQARYNKHFVTEGNFRFGLQTAGFLGNIYKKEGIMALWRGVDSHLVGVVPAR
jgi:hypothetical protein